MRNFFDNESKVLAREVSDYLRQAFLKNLETVDWMDASTKEVAIKKVNTMVESIAYPDELLNNTVLQKEYSQINLVYRSYIMSVLNIKKFEQNRNLNALREPVDKKDWKLQGDVTKNNAFYTPQNNMIRKL